MKGYRHQNLAVHRWAVLNYRNLEGLLLENQHRQN
jgi:hypothetical protein